MAVLAKACVVLALVTLAVASGGSDSGSSSGSGSGGSGGSGRGGSHVFPPGPSGPLQSCYNPAGFSFPAVPAKAKLPVGMTADVYKCLRYNIINGVGLRPFYGEPCDYFDSNKPCAMSHVIGAIVRLPFHDAAGGSNKLTYINGGANGCIDPKMDGNNGLQDIIAKLDGIYAAAELGKLHISKADFGVLVATVSIEYASTPSQFATNELPSVAAIGPLYLPMKMGRVDEANCDRADIPTLPGGDFSFEQTNGVFGTPRMGMTPTQVTAILGAHTVGRASNELTTPGYGSSTDPTPEAPFRGGWSKFQTSFSNAYYNTLVFKGWKQQVGQSPAIDGRNEWLIDGNSQIMLRADVELMLDTHIAQCPQFNGLPRARRSSGSGSSGSGSSGSGSSGSGSSKCPAQHFASGQSVSAVAKYAQPTTAAVQAWWNDFTSAWKIMTEYGYNTASNGKLARKIIAARTAGSSAAVEGGSSSSSSGDSASSSTLSPVALVGMFAGLALVVGLSAFFVGRKTAASKLASEATAAALEFEPEVDTQSAETKL